MVTYRTREEFNQRFGWDAHGPYHLGSSLNFEVERYLQNTGNRWVGSPSISGWSHLRVALPAGAFVKNYDPNCYLLLSFVFFLDLRKFCFQCILLQSFTLEHGCPNSKCSDLMDLGRGHTNFSEGLLRIDAKGTIPAKRASLVSQSVVRRG